MCEWDLGKLTKITAGRIQVGGGRSKALFAAEETIYALLNVQQKEFIGFVLSKYIKSGVDELALKKLPSLLEIKYQSLADAEQKLGKHEIIQLLSIEFQQHLYLQKAA